MVTVVDYKTYQSDDGKEFYALEVQGGIEVIKSQETGRTYLTARKATVPCTFNEETCKALKGTQIEGVIKKLEVEAYNYVIKETGEEISLTHRYEFMSNDESVVKDNVVDLKEVV